VLNVRIVQIDLPKACHLVFHAGLTKKSEDAVVLDIVIEGEFRSGQQADRHLGWTVMDDEFGTVLPNGGEATSARSRKLSREQLVFDLGGPRGDVM
jgi:hypothetical protein